MNVQPLDRAALLTRRWPNFRLAEEWLARAKLEPAKLGLLLVMAPDEGVSLEPVTPAAPPRPPGGLQRRPPQPRDP